MINENYECDGCDFQYFVDGVEYCKKDPESKNPLCPMIIAKENDD